jgi:hypothetical protein
LTQQPTVDRHWVEHVGGDHLEPLVAQGEPGRVPDHCGDGVAGGQGLLEEVAAGLAAGAEDGEPHHVLQVSVH